MVFEKLSMTGTGMISFLIVWALNSYFGISADEGTVSSVVVSAIQVITFIMAIVGQIRRSDVKFGLVRR